MVFFLAAAGMESSTTMMGYDVLPLRGFDVIESISKRCTCILFVCTEYCNYLSKSFTSWFYLSVDVVHIPQAIHQST